MRILVADDHEPTRALLLVMLDLVPGVDMVAEARDGAEAVKLAVTHQADVVLLDVRMPVMDGLDAAELIGLARPQASILLHTADPDLAMQRRADELGVRLFVKTDFQEIVAELEQVSLRARRGAPVAGEMETTVLSALAARSADAVVVVEADESISFYSQAAAALLELPFPARRLEFSELWSAHEFVHRDGTLRSFAGDPLRESLRGGRPVSEEMVELRPDGLLRAFWIGSVPFSDHEGRLLGSAVYLSLLSEALPGETHPAPVETGRVLVAEPDESMREAIRVGLVHEGFTVATVGDGRAALRRALAERYDAVVLDAELPEISGRETCQLLRVESDLPIILLASAEGVIERLLALEVGADDCLARPFATEELVARVRAILRRRRLDAPVVATTVRKLGDLLIDLVSHQLFVDGNLVELTPSEFKVLALLSSEPDRLFTRREIMENLWDSTYVGDERVCDTHISNLRRKIERNPAHPERIVTVRGAGYKLAFQ